MRLRPCTLGFMYMQTGKSSLFLVVCEEKDLGHVRWDLSYWLWRRDPVSHLNPYFPDVHTQVTHRPSVSSRAQGRRHMPLAINSIPAVIW